jgi:hypothetical protein
MPDRLKTPLASIAQHEKIRTKKSPETLDATKKQITSPVLVI